MSSITLGGAAGAAGVAAHGDGLLVRLDVLEESHGALELPAVDGLGGLAGVLEGDPEVGTAGAGRLRGLNLSRGVSDLLRWKSARLASPSMLFRPVFLSPKCHHTISRHWGGGDSCFREYSQPSSRPPPPQPSSLSKDREEIVGRHYREVVRKGAAGRTHHLDGCCVGDDGDTDRRGDFRRVEGLEEIQNFCPKGACCHQQNLG